MSFNLPNPCLLAIIITISTHKGPQFVLHYPPDPDNHGYQAAPLTFAKNGNSLEEDNEGEYRSSSSASKSEDSSSSSSYFSDTDDVITDDDSDQDIPRNYDNAKDISGLPFRRTSGASTFTGSLTSQASSSFNTKSTDKLASHHRHRHHHKADEARKMKSQKYKKRLHRLTRSETNPMNPFHRKALAEAKMIEEIERARQNLASTSTAVLDDDDNGLEGDFAMRPSRHNSRGQGGRRRSSMTDLRPTDLNEHEAFSTAGGNRRRSSHNSERPKKLKNEGDKLKGSAIYEEIALPSNGHQTRLNHSMSPARSEPVIPPDIQAWTGGVSSGYSGGPPGNITSAASAGSSGGSAHGNSGVGTGRGSKVGENSGGLGDGHSSIQGSSSRPTGLSWETVLGFDTNFLSELLVPSRFICNSRFELTVDDMVFLGAPVHVQPDGKWKKRKKDDIKGRSIHSTLQGNPNTSQLESSLATLTLGANGQGYSGHGSSGLSQAYGVEDDADDEFEVTQHLRMPSTENPALDGTVPGRFNKYDLPQEGDSKGLFNHVQVDDASDDSDEEMHEGSKGANHIDDTHKQSQEYTDPKSDMRMFHVVFVMNPPVIEYSFRIEEMYHYILSKFVRTLRYEQARSNYVWKEVSKILQIRDKAMQEGYSATELWDEISVASSLAMAVSQLYEAVATSEIANLTINNKMRSFQIPIQTQFESLPSETERVFTGTYLSTSIQFEDAYAESNEAIANFALLLLDDPETIIRDIRIDMDDPIALMIRSLSPTRSIFELATSHRVDISSIVELAYNLIYWRRARAIYPISHRNIYIVSPLSPLGNLYHFASLFRSKFPALPPLPRILSMLSTEKPKPYDRMIPSRDHREVYLEAVAWLLRYGFVTQLRTFLWLKITRRIKIMVNKDIQIEEERREFDLEKQRKEAAALSSEEVMSPLMQTTDYASNTAHHVKGDSPPSGTELNNSKVVVHAPEDTDHHFREDIATHTLQFPKTALNSTSPGPARSYLQNATSSFKSNNLDHPVSSILMSGPMNNGIIPLSSSTPSPTAYGFSTKTSEHSTSAAISMVKPSNTNSMTSALGSLEDNTIFPNRLSIAPASVPMSTTHINSSIVGSLGIKRGEGSFTSGGGVTGAVTDRSGMGDDEQAVITNEEWIEDSILLDPSSATALQMKWVAKIMEDKPQDVVTLFGKVLKYMDGQHAMESVLVEENISRQELRKLTKSIADYIVIVRHW